MIKGLSRKQAGVIFANWKNGNLEATEEAISHLYSYTEMYSTWVDSHDFDIIAAYRATIDAIFADDMSEAQKNLDRAEGIWNMHYTAA